MNKRGFTLIELLAVIVVLAIIAVIAVPLVLNIIEKAKKGAFQDSAYGIAKAAEYVFVETALEGHAKDQEFIYSNFEESNDDNLTLKYNGAKPEFGVVTLKADGSVSLLLWRDGYCAVKGENESQVFVDEKSSEDCGQASLPPVIEFTGYGNGVQVELTIMPGETLELPDATAEDSFNNDLTGDIQITNNVDENTPGTYTVVYTVTDSNHNTTTRTIIVIVMDNVAPTVTFNPNGNNTWLQGQSSQVTVTDDSGVDNSSLRYLWSTSTTEPNESSFTNTFTNNSSITESTLTGNYYLWILAKDIHGNTSIERSNAFNLDNTAPNISNVSISATDITETGFKITRTGNASDDDSGLQNNPYIYQTSLNGTDWSNECITNTTSCEITNLNSGDSRFYRVCVVDVAFNSSCSASESITTLVLQDPSSPELSDGMIPITWNGSTWVKADLNQEWYNYGNKEWANVVLVNNSSRATYQAASPGTVINENDVMAYLVWIPRYRYQLFNVEVAAVPVQTINIEFESKTTPKSYGSWLTHPAFTFGSEELDGFWVGKFETSTETSSTCYTSASTANCNNANQSPRIKPNVSSLRYQTVANQFATAQKFNESTYGLTNDNDAHMMKNTEWGAVAYLAQSTYGKNSEIWINPNSNYITGCAGTSVSASSTTACHAYTTSNGMQASTTGNVYGIYDMSGGAFEYVMGNYNDTVAWSGINFSTLNSRYYDKYRGTTINNSILGDATGEVRGWNSDYAFFVYSSYPWFVRGGDHGNDTNAGVFSFNNFDGNANSFLSFRVVLVGR